MFPSGQALEWKHNSKGQLAAFHTPEGSHVFSYDPETGLLREAVSRDGQRVAYDYDGHMLTQATWSGVVAGTVHYAYNNDLRLAQMSYAGLTLTNAYDNDGRLHSIAEGNSTTTYGYNTDGTMARAHLADSTAASCATASASTSPVTLESILQGVAVDGEYVDLLRAVASRDLEMKGTKDPTTPDALERSRSQEHEADTAATIYLHQTSYHSKALEGFLITLNFVEMKSHKVPSPFDVHPPTPERIRRIEALSNALQKNMPQDHRLLNTLQFQELIGDLEAFR